METAHRFRVHRSLRAAGPFPPARRQGYLSSLTLLVSELTIFAFRRGEALVRQVRDHSKLPSPALRRMGCPCPPLFGAISQPEAGKNKCVSVLYLLNLQPRQGGICMAKVNGSNLT